MIVQFGTTSKKRNSTEIPTMTASYNCVLKEGCSIVNPVIIIDRKVVGHNYNTAYIADFGRYYWIRDIVYENARQIFYLEVDVLASFKSEIGVHQHYVLRSASQKNGYIIDNYYPITTETVLEHEVISIPFPQYTGSNGLYVMGILNSDTGLNYYGFPTAQFQAFMSYLMSDAFAAAALSALSITLNPQLKLLVDPIQYITGCIWIPVSDPANLGLTEINGINVGPVHTIYAAYDVSAFSTMKVDVVQNATLSKHNHPQAAVRGEYLNSSSFTEVNVFVPPFGTFPVDGMLLAEGSTVLNVQVSLNTGLAHMTLVNSINSETNLLIDAFAQVGIPIPISTVITPGTNIVDIGAKVAGAAASYMTGNIMGAVAGGVSAIDSYERGKIPKASVIGTMGTTLGLGRYAHVEWAWKLVADDDNAKNGRPLCTDIQISTLSGFILCQADEAMISGTTEEAEQVLNFLNTGFFYE